MAPQAHTDPQTSPVPESGTDAAGKRKGMKIRNVALTKNGSLVPRPPQEEERPAQERKPTAGRSEVETKESEEDDAEDYSAEAGRGPAPATGITMSATNSDSRTGGPECARVAAPPANGAARYADRGVFERMVLLNFWTACCAAEPVEVRGLIAAPCPMEGESPSSKWRQPQKKGERPQEWRSQMVDPKAKKHDGKKKEEKAALKPSDTGYRMTQAQNRVEELSRGVQCLLNKIVPQNREVIVDRMAEIEIANADELNRVNQIIFRKALDEPHYCDTYADMVEKLQSRYPKFPPQREGEKPLTFRRVLLNTCQEEFEGLPTTLEPPQEEKDQMHPGEIAEYQKKIKDRARANMKFIGKLYLRELLAARVICDVLHDLLRGDENLPEEHKVECAIELMTNVGYTLEKSYQMEMQKFSARMIDLKSARGPNGRPALSRRVQFAVQDLLDLKDNMWKQKIMKEQAKTMQEIHQDAARDQRKGTEVSFATQTAGMRPQNASQASGGMEVVKSRKGR